MVIRLRTWNINFWLNPRKARTAHTMKEKEKSADEINDWIKKSRDILQDEILSNEIIKDDDIIKFRLLQESSFRLYNPSFTDDKNELHYKSDGSEIHYYEIPGKGSKWGLIIDSNGKAISDNTKYIYDSNAALMSCNFLLNKEIVTLINIYAQTSYIALENIFYNIRPIIEQNNDHLIILAGDFNASDEFDYIGKEKDRKAFEFLKNELKFGDCTKKIPFKERSTMIDPNYNNGKGFQNDYIFINNPYYNEKEYKIKIYKDKNISNYDNLYDHYPLDFLIKL